MSEEGDAPERGPIGDSRLLSSDLSKAARLDTQAGSHQRRTENIEQENFDLKLKVYYLEKKLAQDCANNEHDLLEQNVELKTELDEKNRMLEQREVLLVKARNAIENLQTDVELLQAEAKMQKPTFQKSLTKSERALKETENQLQIANEKARNMQLQLEQITEELRAEKNNAPKLDRDLEQSKMDTKQARTALQKMNSDLMMSNSELRETKIELDKKKRDLERIRSNLEKTNGDVEHLESEVRGLKRSVEESDMRARASQASLVQVQKEHTDMQAQLKLARVNEQDLKQTLQNACEERTELDSLLRELKEQTELKALSLRREFDSALHSLQDESDSFRAALKQRDRTIYDADHNIDALNHRLRDADSTIDRLHSELNHVSEENNMLRGHVDSLTHSLHEAQARVRVGSGLANTAKEEVLAQEREQHSKKLTREITARAEVEESLRSKQEGFEELNRSLRKQESISVALIRTVERVCDVLHSLVIPSFPIAAGEESHLLNEELRAPLLSSDAASITLPRLDALETWVKRKLHRLKRIRHAFMAAANQMQDLVAQRIGQLNVHLDVLDKSIFQISSEVDRLYRLLPQNSGGVDIEKEVRRAQRLQSSIRECLQQVRNDVTSQMRRGK